MWAGHGACAGASGAAVFSDVPKKMNVLGEGEMMIQIFSVRKHRCSKEAFVTELASSLDNLEGPFLSDHRRFVKRSAHQPRAHGPPCARKPAFFRRRHPKPPCRCKTRGAHQPAVPFSLYHSPFNGILTARHVFLVGMLETHADG